MNEQIFLKTMIETVKYDDYNKRDELLGILRNSVITYNQTSDFTRKTWQCWEYIDLRVPIPMLRIARELKLELEKLASIVYIETSEYDFAGLNIKPKPVEINNEEKVEHDVFLMKLKIQ